MTEKETATFAGGCFWCTEAIFQRLRGVISVMPGYTGGSIPNPTYEKVSNGSTGHLEAIQIIFSPQVIQYNRLLDIFFSLHDPTTPNRQGNDIGPQYSSTIFYHSQKQKNIAQQKIDELTMNNKYNRPIVTQLRPFKIFYPAENYHQNFYLNNPDHPYCIAVIDPKITHLLKTHPDQTIN